MRDAIEKFIFGLEKSIRLGLEKIRELANTLINREYEKRNNLGVQNKSKARS